MKKGGDRPYDPNRAEKEKLILEAQKEWGKGSVQKQELEAVKEELVEIVNQPFARTRDDKQLEHMLKSKIRSEDPLADYFIQKQERKRQQEFEEENEESRGNKTRIKSKPIYKGPNAVPNRFGIRPGYRWDGVDRGNGFEQRVALAISEKSAFNEDHYKWATSDM